MTRLWICKGLTKNPNLNLGTLQTQEWLNFKYSCWHQISENLLHILVIFCTRFCWIHQNLLRNLLDVPTDWDSIWCQNISLYRIKICHQFDPNLLNLHKGILSLICSKSVEFTRRNSVTNKLLKFSVWWILYIFLNLVFFNLLNLHKGILLKISSSNFQSGESCLLPIIWRFSIEL